MGFNKKVLVGICGRSGSGKTYVCEKFELIGYFHLNTDKIYHDLLLPVNGALSPCTEEIKDNFGDSVINGDGTLNRKNLASIVFSDSEALKKLNAVTHKYIKKSMYEIIDSTDAEYYLVDAPLLFESGFDVLCDYKICVICSDEKSVERILMRDGISKEKAIERLNSQLSVEELKEKCDFYVINDDIEDVPRQVREISERIKSSREANNEF